MLHFHTAQLLVDIFATVSSNALQFDPQIKETARFQRMLRKLTLKHTETCISTTHSKPMLFAFMLAFRWVKTRRLPQRLAEFSEHDILPAISQQKTSHATPTSKKCGLLLLATFGYLRNHHCQPLLLLLVGRRGCFHVRRNWYLHLGFVKVFSRKARFQLITPNPP